MLLIYIGQQLFYSFDGILELPGSASGLRKSRLWTKISVQNTPTCYENALALALGLHTYTDVQSSPKHIMGHFTLAQLGARLGS